MCYYTNLKQIEIKENGSLDFLYGKRLEIARPVFQRLVARYSNRYFRITSLDLHAYMWKNY